MVTNQHNAKQIKLNYKIKRVIDKVGITNITVIDILNLHADSEMSCNDIISTIHNMGMLHYKEYLDDYKASL